MSLHYFLVFASVLRLSHQAGHWSYNDESHWPGKCLSGERQSPINILPEEAYVDYNQVHIKGPLVFRGYGAVDTTAINNGHTLRWDTVPDSPPPVLSGGPLKGNYTFLQFHLHWLSEHSINGNKYPLEIHMVHIKTGLTVEEAVKRPDGLAVVGVLFQVTEAKNSEYALEELMPMLPNLENVTSGEPDTSDIIDITRLFSPEPQSFYTYEGSLTTPMCDEAVIWIVMDQPVPISGSQYKALSRVDVGGTANFRSIQPTNRVVYRTATSCSSMVVPGILTLISALIHCSSRIINLGRNAICKILNYKRKLVGLPLKDCGKLVN